MVAKFSTVALLIILHLATPSFSADCANETVCKMEQCGNTFCMICTPKPGGGTLLCSPETIPVFVIPKKPFGGDLDIPSIVSYDFSPMVTKSKESIDFNKPSFENFRKSLEDQNKQLDLFRAGMESERLNLKIGQEEYDGGILLYKQGIANYHTGIALVKQAQ